MIINQGAYMQLNNKYTYIIVTAIIIVLIAISTIQTLNARTKITENLAIKTQKDSLSLKVNSYRDSIAQLTKAYTLLKTQVSSQALDSNVTETYADGKIATRTIVLHRTSHDTLFLNIHDTVTKTVALKTVDTITLTKVITKDSIVKSVSIEKAPENTLDFNIGIQASSAINAPVPVIAATAGVTKNFGPFYLNGNVSVPAQYQNTTLTTEVGISF